MRLQLAAFLTCFVGWIGLGWLSLQCDPARSDLIVFFSVHLVLGMAASFGKAVVACSEVVDSDKGVDQVGYALVCWDSHFPTNREARTLTIRSL